MSGKVSGLAVFYATAGGILLWSGFKGQTTAQTIKAITSGSASALAAPGSQTVGSPALSVAPPTSGATGSIAPGTSLVTGTPGQAGGNAAQNQALAKLLAATIHPTWVTGQQWADWVSLWNRESGWSNTADTRKTGAGGDNMGSAVFAYGIAQARPYSKMPKSAWPPDKGGSSNAAAQESWGINYIAQTYGSPSAALAHENSAGWY